MIPFMTEEIYQNLVCSMDQTAPESIHLCDFPVVNEAISMQKLEQYGRGPEDRCHGTCMPQYR